MNRNDLSKALSFSALLIIVLGDCFHFDPW